MYLREPEVAYGKSKFTIPEYLEMEQHAADKHEYYRGEIFAMSGAVNVVTKFNKGQNAIFTS